jgi:uncharacterized surface protein with fasciclin (FAS1) repeats
MDHAMGRAAGDAVATINTLPAQTISNLLISTGNLTTFAAAAKAADLSDALMNKGRFTVFVPTDEAFKKLAPGAFEALLKDHAKLRAVLKYHMVAGHLLTEDLKSGEMATLQGLTLTAAVSGAEVRVNGARVTRANMVAANGVVHAIDSVILPKHWRLVGRAV